MPRARTAEEWRQLAVSTYTTAEEIDGDTPGSLVAVELFARAAAAAAIAVAIGGPRRTK